MTGLPLEQATLRAARDLRFSAISRARARSGTTWNGSSALGTSSRPVMRTGTLGPASSIGLAQVVVHRADAAVGWRRTGRRRRGAACRRCTSSVACTPSPSLSLASRQVPSAGLFGLALSSFSSATRRSLSSSSSMPLPVAALVSTNGRVAAHVVGQHVQAVKLLPRLVAGWRWADRPC